MLRAMLIFAALFVATEPAAARHHRHHHRHQAHRVAREANWLPVSHDEQDDYIARAAPSMTSWFNRTWDTAAATVSQILPHPDGCPRTAFCGCGAAAYLNIHDRSLWLAASWFRFPRAAPAPGMAAVRRHHVFVLEQHLHDNVWLAYDANSGHHLARRHARSIAGYTIVNPRG